MNSLNQQNPSKFYIYIAVLMLSLFAAIPSVVFSRDAINFGREFGGTGGAPFVEMVAPGGVISGISIRSGSLIDKIQLIYLYKNNHTIKGTSRGGSGGNSKTFKLKKGEYITKLGGKYDKYINSIYIRTNKGRREKWGGSGGSKHFKFTGTKDSPIQGVWGRSGALLDAIGVIKKSKANTPHAIAIKNNLSAFKPDPDTFGSKGGNCEKCDTITNPIFPTLTSNLDYEFWRKQNNSLYKIVEKLANSTPQFSSYINDVERVHCSGIIFCEIDTRIDLINKTMGAK